MTAANDRTIIVLVGPTCPTCEADDLRVGAPVGAPTAGRCRDCGTSYYEYELHSDDKSEPTCPGCGVHSEEDGEAVTCEDCGPSDCVYCGDTVYRWQLSEDLACPLCEGEAA